MIVEAEESITCQSLVDLVLDAKRGDRQAQCQLYERYYQSTLALAFRKLGNWDEAEELVQDVFIQAFQRIEQLRMPEAFGGWLRQIVRRMAINRLTRRSAVGCADVDAMEHEDLGARNPLDILLRNERCQQVHSSLERLGETDRQTLEAFYMGGQSLIEMAAYFEAPIGTIKRRLHIARKRLAAEIESVQAI
ncbi:MAG: sigma-70 family RNA polymerase sigma factor [Pirellulaceae bacterium]|nr:sigma-70 family RNA polymerase sigma factor [Pirellulaceae bacterium]